MALSIVFNPFTGKFDYINSGSAAVSIPEYSADPVSPSPGDTWVLALGSGGSPIGLLLSLTYDDNDYFLSYKTMAGLIVRTELD